LSTTLVRFEKSCGTPKEESPLLSMTLINRFEGNCGTCGKEKKPIVIIDSGLICLWRKKLKRKIMTMG